MDQCLRGLRHFRFQILAGSSGVVRFEIQFQALEVHMLWRVQTLLLVPPQEEPRMPCPLCGLPWPLFFFNLLLSSLHSYSFHLSSPSFHFLSYSSLSRSALLYAGPLSLFWLLIQFIFPPPASSWQVQPTFPFSLTPYHHLQAPYPIIVFHVPPKLFVPVSLLRQSHFPLLPTGF